MIRKIKVTDYPRLMEIWESAVLSTHDFLKEEDFIYYKGQLPVYFQYVNLFGFEQEGILIGFMGIAEGNLEGIKEQIDTITNSYNKWLYLFHISSC